MNHNEALENINASEKQSDIEIAINLVSKYYLIQNSILIRFQRKAKEILYREAKEVYHTVTHPVAKRLIMVIIEK